MLLFSAIMVTRNRRVEVCDALESILKQRAIAECIVIVDASGDDTVSILQNRFPQVRLIVNERRRGVSFCRNLAIQEARNEFILQIDDDAVLTREDISETILDYFTDQRFAAVTIPFINIKQSDALLHQSPNPSVTCVAYTYTGTAIMLRRSVFLELGGYSLALEHWGEERDYALRLLNAGYFVIYGDSEPVHHSTSVSRDMEYQNIYLYRNQFFFNFLRAPMLYLPALFVWSLVWCVRNALRSNTISLAIRGFTLGISACYRYLNLRDPMQLSRFRLALLLRRKGGMPLAEVEEWIETHG